MTTERAGKNAKVFPFLPFIFPNIPLLLDLHHFQA